MGTAQKFKEGRGWLTYDTVFRQNNQGPGARWDALDPSLYAAYVGGQGVPAVVICRYCTGADHPAESCALAPFFPSAKASLPPCFSSAGGPGRTSGLLCKSWNLGKCRFPSSCYYRHVCLTCGTPTGLRTALAAAPPPVGRHDYPSIRPCVILFFFV